MTHVVRIQSDLILSQLRTPQDHDRKSRVLIGCFGGSDLFLHSLFFASFIMASVVELSVPKSNSKISVNTGLFINNEFVPSVDNLDRIKYVLRLDHP
jgi:hypothetical protein